MTSIEMADGSSHAPSNALDPSNPHGAWVASQLWRYRRAVDNDPARLALPNGMVYEATGQLAKTDRLDAQVLALFAERVHPTPRPLPDAALQALEALMTRRRQLLDMVTAERNRLEHASTPARRNITEHLRWLARDRRTLRGKRTVWGGRAPVRAVLYMGALVATRRNPRPAGLYRRLIEAGKPKKVALVACMRKLPTILNAMMRTNTTWREVNQSTST